MALFDWDLEAIRGGLGLPERVADVWWLHDDYREPQLAAFRTMRQYATAALALFSGLFVASTTADGFDQIIPSANLSWTPCLNGLHCAKLQVPIDHSNTTLGTASIAFAKLAGPLATADSPTIVLLPGGPGGSGVDLLLDSQPLISLALGPQYNVVSFDPRGVGNSTLRLDCFAGDASARTAFFDKLHGAGVVADPSSSLLEDQFGIAAAYGEACNAAVAEGSPFGYHVTTPAVAHDLLAFVEADAASRGRPTAEAKLWAYGFSYGTVTGATFAALFPERVGRMVLDGVVDAERYYHNDWGYSIELADQAMGAFAARCYAAGEKGCAFWGPSADNITARLDGLVAAAARARASSSSDSTKITQYADLKAVFMQAVYDPPSTFGPMADTLAQLERGNASATEGTFEALFAGGLADDAGRVVRCADSHTRNGLGSLEGFRAFVEESVAESRYVGDIWPLYVETLLCRAMRPHLPDSMVLQDPISAVQKKTAFPILFTANTVDPITPLCAARTMSSRFPGSILLQQDNVGHTVAALGGSVCYFGLVQSYFAGIVPTFAPLPNLTCPKDPILSQQGL